MTPHAARKTSPETTTTTTAPLDTLTLGAESSTEIEHHDPAASSTLTSARRGVTGAILATTETRGPGQERRNRTNGYNMQMAGYTFPFRPLEQLNNAFGQQLRELQQRRALAEFQAEQLAQASSAVAGEDGQDPEDDTSSILTSYN